MGAGIDQADRKLENVSYGSRFYGCLLRIGVIQRCTATNDTINSVNEIALIDSKQIFLGLFTNIQLPLLGMLLALLGKLSEFSY